MTDISDVSLEADLSTELAPAKINLALHVTGRRGDGYHLIDSLVVFTRFGASTKLKLVTAPRGLFGRRLGIFGIGGGQAVAEAAAEGLMDAAERRALWARFGL